MRQRQGYEFYLDMMGEEWGVEIEWRVTYRGSPGQYYGPPENCWPAEAPEWEVESIRLVRAGRGPTWEIDPKSSLFGLLCEIFDEDIWEQITTAPEEDYDD